MAGPSGQPRLKQWWSLLATDQKIAISILGVCGVITLIFSFIRLSDHVTEPFLVPNTVLAQAKVIYDQQNQGQQKLDEMKTKDTDRDGINDYAEQYVYGTSPYLADSDSDGIIDSVEIAMGTNPNCAKGQNCALISSSAADAAGATGTSTESFQDLLNIANQNASVPGIGGTSTQSAATLPSISQLQNMGNVQATGTLLAPGQMTPAALRQYMLQNGLASPTQLNQLTDAQILQLYQDAYTQVQAKYNSDGQPAAGTVVANPQ